MGNTSHNGRQGALLELLARIRAEPNRRRRLALRAELQALVDTVQVDGNGADNRSKSEAARQIDC